MRIGHVLTRSWTAIDVPISNRFRYYVSKGPGDIETEQVEGAMLV